MKCNCDNNTPKETTPCSVGYTQEELGLIIDGNNVYIGGMYMGEIVSQEKTLIRIKRISDNKYINGTIQDIIIINEEE